MAIKLISDIKKNSDLIESEIIKNSPAKWGDSEGFLRKFIPQLDLIAVAQENNVIAGFSCAKIISAANYTAIAFFATRVLESHRNKGTAKGLIKKICSRLIFKEKFLKIRNFSKPIYFVSITANPIVFEVMSRNLKAAPSPAYPDPGQTDLEIAKNFAGIFSPGNKFDRNTFVLEQAFMDSAEYYGDAQKIPWSHNQTANEFLEERLKLKDKTGNGLIFVGRIC